METKYSVRFTGRLQAGLSREAVIANLLTCTNLTPEKAAALLSPGKSAVLKKDVDLDTAEKFRLTFEKAGMVVQIVEDMAAASPDSFAQAKTAQKASVSKPYPAATPGAPTPPIRQVAPENSSASPRANLNAKEDTKKQWLDEPRKVAASRGWRWVTEAVGMFFERPFIWFGMTGILMLIGFILSLVPVAGFLCSPILSSVFYGGLMLAAQAQINGEQLTIGFVFRGFSHNRNQLLLIGACYLISMIILGLLLFAVVGADSLAALRSSRPAVVAPVSSGKMPFLLFLLLLSIPMMMAYWFAPSLVALADMTAGRALALSFRGCLRNWAAFLVFGLPCIVFFIILGLVVATVMAIVMFILNSMSLPASVVLSLVGIAILVVLMMSIMMLTVFTGFRDIYYRSA
jgi:hypothetical protein